MKGELLDRSQLSLLPRATISRHWTENAGAKFTRLIKCESSALRTAAAKLGADLFESAQHSNTKVRCEYMLKPEASRL